MAQTVESSESHLGHVLTDGSVRRRPKHSLAAHRVRSIRAAGGARHALSRDPAKPVLHCDAQVVGHVADSFLHFEVAVSPDPRFTDASVG